MEIDRYFDEIEKNWPQRGEGPARSILDLCLQAVTEYPQSSALWYDLGLIASRCADDCGYTPGDYARFFENAIKFGPGNAEAYQELGYALDVYFDDYGRAEKSFAKAIELGAGMESHLGRARVLAEMGRTHDAIQSLSEASCPFHEHAAVQSLRSEITDGIWGAESKRESKPERS